MRKLLRTHLFGGIRKTNLISRYFELLRETFNILELTDIPAERYELLRHADCLERAIRRIGRL